MAGFVLVVLAAGYGFGAIFDFGVGGLIAASIFSVVMTWVSYRNGDKIVLRMSRAREVSPEDEPRLHNLVEGLSIAAGLPKPRLYIVEDQAPNAFATGRDPAHASVAVTRGLLEKLNRIELEGVLAHELAHVGNRDTLVMAIVATLVGVVVLLADWSLRGMLWGGGRRRGGGGNAGGGAFAILGLVGLVLMPLVARIMQMAVSRRREFYADVRGVQLTRYPPGLISALEKLKADETIVKTAGRATGHLWIESPLPRGANFVGRLNRMFDTHPPLDERLRVLRELL
ncbi:MAG TPA: M48 family metallopeptidase [Actinomycetota bacterium]|nr:M48 family metallopeptidase [Actinomycetota bacterium]